jgi:hypothetical protein
MGRKQTVSLELALGVPVLITLAAGGTTASADRTSATYVCAYGKRYASLGRIYWAMSVSPKVLGPTFCRAFNSGFRGRRHYAGTKLGTGREYCRYS